MALTNTISGVDGGLGPFRARYGTYTFTGETFTGTIALGNISNIVLVQVISNKNVGTPQASYSISGTTLTINANAPQDTGTWCVIGN